MTVENKKSLESKIKHYVKAGDYITARRFAVHYKNIEGFDLDEALLNIDKTEKAQKKAKPNQTK
ncbi:MAG TPA: hypothetical protein VGC02_04890 [Methanobacterium sp.]